MTVYPALRRISSSFKSIYSTYCNGGFISGHGLKTSAVKCAEDQSNHDSVVTYKQLKAMLTSRSVQLFDVRKSEEYQAGKIPTAVNIPLDQLEKLLQLLPEAFERRFKVKPPEKKDNNIVFYCQRGRRSLNALEIAWRLGYSRSRHYAGGYSEWAEKEKQ